jgi:hypothetical protein
MRLGGMLGEMRFVGWLVVGSLAGCGGALDGSGSLASRDGGSGSGGTVAREPDGSVLPPSDGRVPPLDPGCPGADSFVPCVTWSTELEPGPATIEFVVDVSGSMHDLVPNSGGQSKWQVTRAAIRTFIGSLPAADWLGISFFPNRSATSFDSPQPAVACIDPSANVAVAPLDAAQRAALDDALGRLEPTVGSATPIDDAFDLAVDALVGSGAPGVKYLVLIIDGPPTQARGCVGNAECTSPVSLTSLVNGMALACDSKRIKTAVIDLPDSDCIGADSRVWLPLAASAGGTGLADDLSGAPSLASALAGDLAALGNSAVSCVYSVPRSPSGQVFDPDLANLVYDDGSGNTYYVVADTGGTCELGWRYDSSRSIVEICGRTCDTIAANPLATLTLMNGCVGPPFPIC